MIGLRHQEGMDRETWPVMVAVGWRMELHGAGMSRTWVKLGETARAGATRVVLAERVDGWRVGDRAVVPTTAKLSLFTASNDFPWKGGRSHLTFRAVGLDALDIMFRIEKSFRVKVSREEMDFIYGAGKPRDEQVEPTAGEIHDRLCEVLRNKGMEPPADSWRRVQSCIADGIGRRGLFGDKFSPGDVRRESLLVKDLGCS